MKDKANPNPEIMLMPHIDVCMTEGVDKTLKAMCLLVKNATIDAYGALDGHCSPAAAALTIMLRQKGYDAQLIGGQTLKRPIWHLREIEEAYEDGFTEQEIALRSFGSWVWWQHCWVQCEGLRLDPTVGQFRGREDELSITNLALLDEWYWQDTGKYAPPKHSSARYLRQSLRDSRCLHGWDEQANRDWLQTLGLQDVAPLRKRLSKPNLLNRPVYKTSL